MKTKIFLLLVASHSLTWAKAQTLKIDAPTEFQFIHCSAQASKNKKLIKHYVIDIRTEQHALYAQLAAKNAKATELTNLQLIDDQLLSNTLDVVDVSWISEKSHLTFKLNIMDNDGFLMSGTLAASKIKTKIRCRDITIE
ncbi:MAG: hypothetical protein AABY53_01330 [Bdellovibrionota bacterium]